MIAIWMRNTLLILLPLVLVIAALLMLPRFLFILFNEWSSNYSSSMEWTAIFLYILSSSGISVNLLRMNTPNAGILNLSKAWHGINIVVLCLLIAWQIGCSANFNLAIWSNASVIVALLLLAGGFFLHTAFIQMAKHYWPENITLEKINYTQKWVQIISVIPLVIMSTLLSFIIKNHIDTTNKDGVAISSFENIFTQGLHLLSLPFIVIFVSFWIFSFCSIRSFSKNGWFTALLAPFPAILVLYTLLAVIMNWASGLGNQWQPFIWTPVFVLLAFSVAIVILIGMMGRNANEDVREWWSRFGAWLAIYVIGWLIFVVTAIYTPILAIELKKIQWVESIGIVSWLATTLAGRLFAGKSIFMGSANGEKNFVTEIKKAITKIAPFVFIAGLLMVISMEVHHVFDIEVTSDFISGRTRQDYWQDLKLHYWVSLACTDIAKVVSIFIGCIISAFLFSWRVDINEFSLDSLYRRRLVRCYLGAARLQPVKRKPQYFTGFDDDDDFTLAKLAENKKVNGPLHIINCAVSLGKSSDLNPHTRPTNIFTLTPLYCGSSYKSRNHATGEYKEIGYVLTGQYGGEEGQPTLGQAMAVSGSVVNSRVDYQSSSTATFLLTLFNVRLGRWFPNPLSSSAIKQSTPGNSLLYLIMELFDLANHESDFLAISDGGQFENLAAYELVKRKCKLIIISDAEFDPKLQFKGLGSLIRKCKIDFDADIDIDVGSISLDEKMLWSRGRYAIGKITYKDTKHEGILIYIKACMNGHEDTAVLKYKAAHPDFPHEKTDEQLYGDDQFESYRALGSDITKKIFKKFYPKKEEGENTKDDKETSENNNAIKNKDVARNILMEWADDQKRVFAPTLIDVGKFSDHANRLMKLWNELSQNEELKSLDNELTDNWPTPFDRDKNFRSVFYLCSEMIQLMENVYLDLKLEDTWDHPDNRGWRTLFKKWAKSAQLNIAWELTRDDYGLRFQHFWDTKFKTIQPTCKETTS